MLTDFTLHVLPDMTPSLPRHIVIFGLGYTSCYLVELLLQHDVRVTATCRTVEKKQKLQTLFPSIHIIPFNSMKRDCDANHALKKALCDADAIISSIPPSSQEQDDDPILNFIESVYIEASKKQSSLTMKQKKWVGYLSATSVYGDHKGAWVHEESTLRTQSIRGLKRLKAEKTWHNKLTPLGIPVFIFRLPGIYGPSTYYNFGRNVFDKIIQNPDYFIHKPGHLFCRIHVYDIIRALYRSMCVAMTTIHHGTHIYNVSDDKPATQEDVYSYAAALMKIQTPQARDYKKANISAMMRSFYTDNRKIDNTKIKKDLGFSFMFPTFKEGLKHIFMTSIKHG